jgi:hypothetical protein
VWASFLVIAGVMLALRRRMRDQGAAPVQRFAEDFMPLILLFAVSVTGLMLTASYTWMKGYAYTFIAILHAITVIGTFLWLPFGKFFHIFQRPAQLGSVSTKTSGSEEAERHAADAAGTPSASRMHVEDLIEVEKQAGLPVRASPITPGREHYQWICPALPSRLASRWRRACCGSAERGGAHCCRGTATAADAG